MAQGKIVHMSPFGREVSIPPKNAPPASPPRSPFGIFKSAEGPATLKALKALTKGQRKALKAKQKEERARGE
jgi:hypothetical protein